MNKKEQLLELFKSQDIIRRLWANETNLELEHKLKQLDKHILQIINFIGER